MNGGWYCPFCHASTSGNCGRHAPPSAPLIAFSMDELSRLRDELKREREVSRLLVVDVKEAEERMWQHRDALAAVTAERDRYRDTLRALSESGFRTVRQMCRAALAPSPVKP